MMNHTATTNLHRRRVSVAVILVTALFFLWGVANNMTDTLLAAFKRIMSMSDMQTTLIQFAFYGAYFCFALPAAIYLKKFSFKSGIILGLALYAAGTMLFLPASQVASYGFFLVAIYIMAGGCSVLETTANPYILIMGDRATAIRRLNVAQSFNPLGSITGILLSQYFILSELSTADAGVREAMSPEQLSALQAHELGAVTGTYMALGVVLLLIMVAICCIRMPREKDQSGPLELGASFRRLMANKVYRRGVIAQFFYVGAQIGVWSFTIQIVMTEFHILEKDAATVSLVSIICFSVFRFFFTWLMKYVRPVKLLVVASVLAAVCSLMVVLGAGTGLVMAVALVLVSAFMSLMFPTIYGLALEDVGADAKVGASGLIMAILGGALLPLLQGVLSDRWGLYVSYLVPFVCFIVVLLYGCDVMRNERAAGRSCGTVK